MAACQTTKPITALNLWPRTPSVRRGSQRTVLAVAGRVEGPRLRGQSSGGSPSPGAGEKRVDRSDLS